MNRILIIIVLNVLLGSNIQAQNIKEKEREGGILIINGNSEGVKCLLLLDREIKLDSTNRNVIVKPLKPGYYDIIIKKTFLDEDLVIKNIEVSADSLSIFPVLYFSKIILEDSLLMWGNKKNWYRKREKEYYNSIPLPIIPCVDYSFFPILPNKICTNKNLPISSVTGKVIDRYSGKPLKNITIDIATWYQTKTDENGNYFFDNILEGTYNINAFGKVNEIGYGSNIDLNHEISVKKDSSTIENFKLEKIRIMHIFPE